MARDASAVALASSSSFSSDDDDDEQSRRSLVSQNDAKPLRRPRSPSTFEIDGGDLPSRLVRRLFSNKRCLLLVLFFLPLLVILFFSLHLGRLFSKAGFSTARDGSGSGRDEHMLESELRALYLLRNQQLELLKLWNRTLPPVSAEIPAPSPALSPNSTAKAGADLQLAAVSMPSAELRLALLRQIRLNREIQKALLSSHRVGNTSSLEMPDDELLFDVAGSGELGVCKKMHKPKDRRTIEWKPKKDKYLFAICVSGQMSNHLICLEKHMFFAALLNRVLILPSSKFDYQYDRVLDIDHINKCFGRNVVVMYDDFAKMKNNKIKIDRLICYMASPPCFIDGDHIKTLKNLGISLGKIEVAWPEDAKLKTPNETPKRVVEDVLLKFEYNDDVIAIGDVFYANVEEEWVMQPGGALAHKCQTVIQPSRLIYVTAQRFVQTFMGANFLALHFRRHGFLKFCNAKEKSCFFPIPQAAECIIRVLEKTNAPVIYLSTDAAESETKLLQSMVVFNDKQVPLVRRPEQDSAEKWDSLLYRNHLGGDNQVEAMLDKTICALSTVFIGASGSTFTEDIIRLRRGWESASECDEYLCQGELPNYIAVKE